MIGSNKNHSKQIQTQFGRLFGLMFWYVLSFFVFGTFLTGFKGLCFRVRVGTKMQQANRILNEASSLTSHLIIGIASCWFRAGCLGLFRFWFRAIRVCVPCFPPRRTEKNHITPQKLVGKPIVFSDLHAPNPTVDPLFGLDRSWVSRNPTDRHTFFGGTKDR